MRFEGPHSIVAVPATLDATTLARFDEQLAAAIACGQPLLLLGGKTGAFCTGLDLESNHGQSQEAHKFAGILLRLWQAPLPTVAAIDGRAFGGGLGIACACDRILATDRATFALPELLWGFVPAIIWPLVRTRLCDSKARWWALTGHARTVAEAVADGLVDELSPSDAWEATLRRALRACQRADRDAIPALRRLAQPDMADRIAEGAAMTAVALGDPKVRRRLAAYARGEAPWIS
jgi:enoyl-CoA hydratase/carnithine racemase